MATLTQKYANPTRFMSLSAMVLPWLTGLAALVTGYALYRVFLGPDLSFTEHKHNVLMMFVHVPCAWIAMACYGLVAASSFGLLVFRHPLADVSAKAAAPIGAVFTALALITGWLWGVPGWNLPLTQFYLFIDARIASVIMLFFLYLGLIALRSSIEDEAAAAKLTAILALVGVAILPFIKISVEGVCIPSLGIDIPGWNTLHQPSSTLSTCRRGTAGPRMDPRILSALLWSAAGFTLVFLALHMKAMQNEILRRRIHAMRQAEVDRARSAPAHAMQGAE